MTRRRTYTRPCAAAGCPEFSQIEYTARRDLDTVSPTWNCRQHDKPGGTAMTTPAEEIRTAADTLRRTATAAGGDTWQADHFPEGTIVHPTGSTQSLFRLAADGNRAAGTPHVLPAIGDQIATMDPALGLLLARWLDSWGVVNLREHAAMQEDARYALLIARAINGRP